MKHLSIAAHKLMTGSWYINLSFAFDPVTKYAQLAELSKKYLTTTLMSGMSWNYDWNAFFGIKHDLIWENNRFKMRESAGRFCYLCLINVSHREIDKCLFKYDFFQFSSKSLTCESPSSKHSRLSTWPCVMSVLLNTRALSWRTRHS